jgi:hypothetical protein
MMPRPLSRLLLVAAAVAATLTIAGPAHAAQSVEVKLQDVNSTGAAGTATLTVTGSGDLIVQISSTGLAANLPHLQHLHGSVNGMDYHCPDKATDTNRDGYVSLDEGMPMYGGIFLSLTTTGDTSWTSGLAINRMPVADAHGNLSYERTIPAADLPPGTVAHLEDLHLVQHGVDANRNGRYDLAGLGESTFATSLGVPNIPAEETDPVTCGLMTQAAAVTVPRGGVATGDGSRGVHHPGATYAAGGVLALGALLISVWWRRKAWRAGS